MAVPLCPVPWLRRAVAYLYGSPARCLWFLRLRLLDATAAALICVWHGLSALVEALKLSEGRLATMFFCCFAMGFAVSRFPWVVMLERSAVRVVSYSQQEGSGPRSIIAVLMHQAAEEMLVSGLVFSMLFATFSYFQFSMSYVFVVVNSCSTVASVIILALEPPADLASQVGAPRGEPGAPAAKRLSQEVISRLPAHDFGDPLAPSTKPQCSICLEEFSLGDKVRYLPCGHHYHSQCVDPWLACKAACPMRCHFDLEACDSGSMLALPSAPQAGHQSHGDRDDDSMAHI